MNFTNSKTLVGLCRPKRWRNACLRFFSLYFFRFFVFAFLFILFSCFFFCWHKKSAKIHNKKSKLQNQNQFFQKTQNKVKIKKKQNRKIEKKREALKGYHPRRLQKLIFLTDMSQEIVQQMRPNKADLEHSGQEKQIKKNGKIKKHHEKSRKNKNEDKSRKMRAREGSGPAQQASLEFIFPGKEEFRVFFQKGNFPRMDKV